MSPWRTVPRKDPTKPAQGRVLWNEECVQVGAVRRLDRDAGRTGKGLLHFFPSTSSQKHGERIGQHRTVDLEDVISITDHPIIITQ